MTARATILLLALLATPLAAQSNAERIANDAYSRSHDYDLVHQRIELRNFDWDSTGFDGRVTLTVVALRPGFDSVIVDAGKLLDVKSVTDPRGRALDFGRRGDTLVVRLPRPAAYRDTVRFSVAYHGRVQNGRGLTFIAEEPGIVHRPQQIWSQGESSDNHLWFPTYDFPNDKMTWELEATVPAPYTVVSNGRLTLDRRNPGGTSTTRWAQEKPSATYLVSIVVAPLVKIRDAWRGVPVDYYVYREDSALARPLFRVTPDMIQVYSRLTGVKYPWAKYAQTTVADFFGGMENVSATTLVDWLPDRRAYLDRPWYQYILIPHELAHQWFGDDVTLANWANMWLNEGFAEFMPCQYWREKRGAAAEEDCYSDEYDSFLRIDRRRRMPLASNGSNNIYPKGALVLRMLQRHLGRERFWAAIHEYLGRHALGNATSDDLRQAVLRATGENLDWFWDQWVYQAGYPEFVVAATWDSAGRSLSLAVKQVQADSSRADSTGLRFTTPAVFRMPLSVRVGTTAGDVTWRGWIDQREQTFEIPNVASAPTMVIFDQGNTILKTLTFDQPTAWLASQLARDPDLWNRGWVIRRLADRPNDPDAAAALARAATGADYPLTRAQAASALGGFPVAVALDPLAAATADTSAAVRAAAVTALGEVGGSRALALGRERWLSDSSYAVRAAALEAVVKGDSAGRRAVIAEGLATESYRDEIRNAALSAIYATADTTFIDRADTLMIGNEIAGYILGGLANLSPRALDLLTRRLDDPRPSIRKRALEAFGQTVDPRLAVAHLESVVAGLRYADARDGVGALVERLKQEAGKGR